jgi:hypothetical protein
MYKVPAKYKSKIVNELKAFLPIINGLISKGKTSTEEDARIILNDLLHSVLGYNKFNELKTEVVSKNGRVDYVVKLTDGPLSKKPEKFDFVIEAKACYVELSQTVIDQTLTYCNNLAIEHFFITNAREWHLYSVISKKGKPPIANLIHKLSLSSTTNLDDLAEEFYLFSKAAYLNGDWKKVSDVKSVTRVEDVVAVLLCDKTLKLVARELSTDKVKVSEESIKDIFESNLLKQWVGECNKKLLAKLNEKPKKENKPTNEAQAAEPELINSDTATESIEGDTSLDIPEVPKVA